MAKTGRPAIHRPLRAPGNSGDFDEKLKAAMPSEDQLVDAVVV
jgi:hypothetical protein